MSIEEIKKDDMPNDPCLKSTIYAPSATPFGPSTSALPDVPASTFSSMADGSTSASSTDANKPDESAESTPPRPCFASPQRDILTAFKIESLVYIVAAELMAEIPLLNIKRLTQHLLPAFLSNQDGHQRFDDYANQSTPDIPYDDGQEAPNDTTPSVPALDVKPSLDNRVAIAPQPAALMMQGRLTCASANNDANDNNEATSADPPASMSFKATVSSSDAACVSDASAM
ncbi:hypothetical protein HK102_007606, partial [Quaeritorhiza haematococci]